MDRMIYIYRWLKIGEQFFTSQQIILTFLQTRAKGAQIELQSLCIQETSIAWISRKFFSSLALAVLLDTKKWPSKG